MIESLNQQGDKQNESSNLEVGVRGEVHEEVFEVQKGVGEDLRCFFEQFKKDIQTIAPSDLSLLRLVDETETISDQNILAQIKDCSLALRSALASGRGKARAVKAVRSLLEISSGKKKPEKINPTIIKVLIKEQGSRQLTWPLILSFFHSREDFLLLFDELGFKDKEWMASANMLKKCPGLFQAIKNSNRFGSWRGFGEFMGKSKPLTEQIAECLTRADFLKLFSGLGISKDSWKDYTQLTKDGFGNVLATISLDHRFKNWSAFRIFMGEEIRERWNTKIAKCVCPQDFLTLFSDSGAGENWKSTDWMRNHDYSGLCKAITMDERFNSWKSFLNFMEKGEGDTWAERVNNCTAPNDFHKLFQRNNLRGQWKTISWLEMNGYAGLALALRNDARFDSWQAFLDFMDIENEEAEQEFEKLSALNLEEAIALLQDDPLKLKEYLQFAHQELSEEEIDRLVICSFKGMRMGALEMQEEKYLQWERTLADIRIIDEPPRTTIVPTVVLSGKAPEGATHIFISGACTRTKRLEEDHAFTLRIPLKIGKANEIRVMAINKNGKTCSDQEHFTIKQKGEEDDVAALVDLLSKLKDNTLAEVQQNPGRFRHLCRCMEQSLIKRFGKSFADGKRYVEELIGRSSTGPAMRKVLKSVLKKFKDIHATEIPGIVPGSLLFFQKYCALDIRRRIEEELPGVFLSNAPGTGKTRIVQAATADRDTTVITPNSVVSAWDEESGKVLEETDVLALRGISSTIRKEQLRTRKRLKKTLRTPQHTYINREFLQRVNDTERFKLLSDSNTIVVHDEGHSRANEQSLQSKGAAMLESQFQILVSATPFKNPRTFRRMMAILRPKDRRFSSDAAFTKAFPAGDPQALRALSLFKQEVTLRFREEDVFETVNPKQALSQQKHRLPGKEFIDPEKMGKFEMSEDQAESIYQMFINWNRWCRTNNKYIPKDRTAKEDHLRVGDGFAKRHALRQTVNNPGYINSKAPDAKLAEVRKIVEQCMKEGRKVVIFCSYEAQTKKYAEAFKDLQPTLYTGEISSQGDKKDANGRAAKFKKGDSDDDHHAWMLDPTGHPLADVKGEPMSALDYERITYQNVAERKLLIATYSAGSVGSTFTAGNAMILDDVPADCVEAIQAEGRIRRIDPNRLTHATKKYYSLQSTYPETFLKKVAKRWLVKKEHHYKEFDSREAARKYAEPRGLRVLNAAEEFFDQGTYDQVHGRNLKVQRVMFNLINDGIADETILEEDQEVFAGLKNGKNAERP